MKRVILVLILAWLVAGPASAQYKDGASLPSYNSLFNNNFLDLNRLTIKQSFSLSYLSTNQGGLVSNLYRNSMSYKLTDKLELNLDLAYRFTPDQFNSLNAWQNGGNKQGMFLPSFGMKYQPSGSFLLEFQFNQVDPYWCDPYHRDRRF